MFKLARFLRPFLFLVAGALSLVFLQALSELYLPNLMSRVVDTGIVRGDTGFILRVGGQMLLVAAGGMLCSVLAALLSSRTAAGFGRDLRAAVFSRVESFSLHEFDRFGTASLITRTTNDITQLQMVVLIGLRMVAMAPLMCIGGIIMAIREDAHLAWILVMVLPLLAGIVFAIARRGVPLFRALQTKLDKLNLVLREGLTGVRVIRAFDRQEHERRRFAEANLDLTATAITVNRTMAGMMPLMMLVMNLSAIAIVWFGGLRLDQGRMQVGSLMAFLQYAMQIMWSLTMASLMFVMIPRASASAARINEVLDTVPEITDPPAPKPPGELRGLVEFRDVTFRYPGAEQPALSHVSFTARPGEVTAIIGGTGSGKSTLISLIPRFYDVTEGAVLVDGVDVREQAQESLRAKIGFVPQKAVLFSGTIADNIRFGKPDATDEEVRRATKTAQAMEFVSALEDGFASVLAQGGTNVSGGQKQRLSIARALVRRPEIYVFDDSFSALDFKTDARLRAALRRETADATVIVVAQRVSSIREADQIVVLDQGQVVGVGRHQELLQTCEVYREIVSSQLSPEESA